MASPAIKAQRATRRRMFVRTMMACGALFLAIFTLMAGQMLLGQDPALGAGRQTQTSSQLAQRTEGDGGWKTAAGQAVGAMIGGVIADAASDDDDEGTGQASPSASQSPPPVQSGSS